MRPLRWCDGALELLDQRRLPATEVWLRCTELEDVARAIETMAVRGAPAIGIAAAFGFYLGCRKLGAAATAEASRAAVAARLAATRPTAYNLFWALARMEAVARQCSGLRPDAFLERLCQEAQAIADADVAANRAIGRHGQTVVPDGARVLTHCNAGALATGGYGTALGVLRAAREAGKRLGVLACETRPLLQGARLTAWELGREGMEVTLITDGMAGHFMARGEVDLVLVGADRIAANGDVANKIGTYSLAVLARAHGVPFYVAAPCSTVDLTVPDGAGIVIEERDPDEVLCCGGVRIAPPGATAANPAFDVTPHRYLTGIITDRGLLEPPFSPGLARLVGGG